MQFILGIDWRNLGNYAKVVAQSFVLGSFIQGLNDPVHHRDFGSKGVYTSQTIEDATNFLHHFCIYFTERERIAFLSSLASLVKQESFGRAGLMALSFCIASSARGPETHDMESSLSVDGNSLDNDKALLLDILRLVIESSKQHFNPNYRFQVCEKILEAASSVMYTSDVPVETLMHFIAKVPREFTDYGGSLREKVKEWLSKCEKKNWQSDSKTRLHVLESLCDFPQKFVLNHNLPEASDAYDDEDLEAWGFEAQRWGRLLFLKITEELQLEPLVKLLQDYGIHILRHNNMERVSAKFLILLLSLIQELSILQGKYTNSIASHLKVAMLENSNLSSEREASIDFEKIYSHFTLILEELVLFAKSSCSIFWAKPSAADDILPCVVTGKLGVPSRWRLSSYMATTILNVVCF